MKKFSEMTPEEAMEVLRSIKKTVDGMDLPKDLTYVIQIFGPESRKHWCMCDNAGKHTAEPVKAIIRYILDAMKS